MSPYATVELRCKELGYDVHVIRGPSKASEYVKVRRLIAAQLQDEGCSYPTIGRALNRDHSTIVSLLKGGKHKAPRRLP